MMMDVVDSCQEYYVTRNLGRVEIIYQHKDISQYAIKIPGQEKIMACNHNSCGHKTHTSLVPIIHHTAIGICLYKCPSWHLDYYGYIHTNHWWKPKQMQTHALPYPRSLLSFACSGGKPLLQFWECCSSSECLILLYRPFKGPSNPQGQSKITVTILSKPLTQKHYYGRWPSAPTPQAVPFYPASACKCPTQVMLWIWRGILKIVS